MSTEIRGVVTRATGSWYDVLHDRAARSRCRIRGRTAPERRPLDQSGGGGRRGGLRAEGGDGEWVIERHPAAPQLRHPARLEPLERVAHHRRKHRPGTARGHAASQPVDGPRSSSTAFWRPARPTRSPRRSCWSKLRPRSDRPRSRRRTSTPSTKAPATASLEVSALGRHGASTRCVRTRSPAARRSLSGNSGVGKSTLDPGTLDPSTGTSARAKHLRKPPQRPAYDHLLDDVPPGRGRRSVIDTPGIKGFGLIDIDDARAVALFSRDDARRARLPLLQLHPHPRAGLCRDAKRSKAGEMAPGRATKVT